MDKCRQQLIESIEAESDYSIDVLISVQNVCLDVNDTFTLYDVENADVTGELAIKSLVRGFLDNITVVEERTRANRYSNLQRMSFPCITSFGLTSH